MKAEEIQNEIFKFAKENGYKVTKYAPAIAEAKRRMCADWRSCPCHRDKQHFCGSPTCAEEINTKGVCGCNLYRKG